MFDCIIVGGGIAGLQAAIQLGRYQRNVLVLDANRGRSTLCQCYHNLLGWPDGVSGLELRRLGRTQAQRMGVRFENRLATGALQTPDGFLVHTDDEGALETKTLLIATGVVDHIPPIPGLQARLGTTLYVCTDCDGYECRQKSTVVLGGGDVGAQMALTLLHWTQHVTYVNHTGAAVHNTLLEQLRGAEIRYIDGEIEHLEHGDSARLGNVVMVDGQIIEADRGFVAFGGNRVESRIAGELGAVCLNRHIAVHPRTKMTSVRGLWAAGDVVAHSEQVSIAMGDGSQAAIFIHKALQGEMVECYATVASST